MQWQLQEAKQRFSELVRRAEVEGPQVVTRHNQEVVVVFSAEDYRRLRPGRSDFKEFLATGPDLGVLEISRDQNPTRAIDLSSRRSTRS